MRDTPTKQTAFPVSVNEPARAKFQKHTLHRCDAYMPVCLNMLVPTSQPLGELSEHLSRAPVMKGALRSLLWGRCFRACDHWRSSIVPRHDLSAPQRLQKETPSAQNPLEARSPNSAAQSPKAPISMSGEALWGNVIAFHRQSCGELPRRHSISDQAFYMPLY